MNAFASICLLDVEHRAYVARVEGVAPFGGDLLDLGATRVGPSLESIHMMYGKNVRKKMKMNFFEVYFS